MKDFADRVAVITGAGSGIGRASALAFARADARVVIGDIDRARADAVATEAAALGPGAFGQRCDVSAEGDLEALRDTALARFGRVDIVMNNVGVIAAGLPEAIPFEAWQRIIEINLLSVVRSNLAFMPLLLERGDGHIVYTASTNPLYPYSFDRLPYTATKGAVLALAESLALYLKPRGVGVTVLCPGPVATNISEQMRFYGEPQPVRSPDLAVLQPAQVADMVLEAIRTDRFLLLTHPEVRDLMVERARDPDAFLVRQIDRLSRPPG